MVLQQLSARQKQYIWIMGSFPAKIAVQGRGYRTKQLLYGFEEDEVIIFGYSDPFMWLVNRGLVRKLANNTRAHVLTDEGERHYRHLVISDFGFQAKELTREVKVAPK